MLKKIFTPKPAWKPNKSFDQKIPYSSQELGIIFSQNNDLKVDFLLMHGGRGTGKSDWLLYTYFMHCMQGYGSAWTGYLLRTQFGALKNIFNRAVEMAEGLFVRDVDFRVLTSSEEFSIQFSTGEVLYFRHLANEQEFDNKYKGVQMPWIGLEEFTLWENLKLFEDLKSCNRIAVEDGQKKPPVMMRATTNPDGPGHEAVKNAIIYKSKSGEVYTIESDHPLKKKDANGNIIKTKYTQMHIYTNFLENVKDNGESRLGDDYLAKFEALKETNYAKWLMWVMGSWDVPNTGMLFNEVVDFDSQVVEPFRIPPATPIYRAFDYGTYDPFCMLYYIVTDGEPFQMNNGSYKYYPRGTIIIIKEIYGAKELSSPNKGIKISNKEMVKLILETEAVLKQTYKTTIFAGPADDLITRGEGSGNTSINQEHFKPAGIKFKRANKKDDMVAVGCGLVRDALQATKINDPDAPHLIFFNTCKFTVKTIFNLKPDHPNTDKPAKGQADHALDVVRYIKLLKASKTSVSDL